MYRFPDSFRSHLLAGGFALLAALSFAAQPSLAVSSLDDQPFTFSTFRKIAQEAKPGVVNISVTQKAVQGNIPPELGPWEEFFNFHPFFNERPERRPSPESQAQGSGAVLDREGHIVTNNHVVENAKEISVKFLDNPKTFTAEVVGLDPKTDLAVIKVIDPPANLTPLKFGDSEHVDVGDWVMAIGHPFGLEHTVSVGVVSAKSRSINMGNYDDFIQTDASINPGNSGGPLVNLNGEIVGINTAIFTRSGGSMGIGFAIPSNMARSIIGQLKNTGSVERGYLGVMIQNLDEDLAKSFGLSEPSGALVRDVVPDGPAAEAGIAAGDVILEFNGKPVKASRDLPLLVADTPVGSKAKLTVYRESDGKSRQVNVTIGKLEDEETVASKGSKPEADAGRFGMQFSDVSPALVEEYGLDKSVTGVVITAVQPGSPAMAADLQEGDVIFRLNRAAVTSAKEVSKLLREAKTGDLLMFHISRGSKNVFRTLKVTE